MKSTFELSAFPGLQKTGDQVLIPRGRPLHELAQFENAHSANTMQDNFSLSSNNVFSCPDSSIITLVVNRVKKHQQNPNIRVAQNKG